MRPGAFILDIALRLLKEVCPRLEVTDSWVIRERGSQSQYCIMQHGGVVGLAWGRLILWFAQGPAHVTEKEGRNDSQAPTCEELEDEIEDSKGERDENGYF